MKTSHQRQSLGNALRKAKTRNPGWFRSGSLEPLESRELLTVSSGSLSAISLAAASLGELHNAAYPTDVNRDGHVTPSDAISVINYLDHYGSKTDSTAVASPALALAPNGVPQALDVNGDGVVTPTDAIDIINRLNASASDLAQVTLEATDASGNILTTVPEGTAFQLRAVVQDISSNAANGGVFSAYINTTYDSTLASIPSDASSNVVTFGPAFSSTQKENTQSPGLIQNTGALDPSLTPSGPASEVLFTVPVTATSPGSETFTPSISTTISDDFILYGDNSALTASQVNLVPATITITSNSTTMAVNSVTVPEVFTGSTTASFTVSLAAPVAQQVTVQYATSDGSATAPANYTATQGTLTFAPGVTMMQVNVPVSSTPATVPTSQFFLNLSNVTGPATLVASQGVATITPPSLSIDDVTETIGTSGITNFVFDVHLSTAAPNTVTVGYATADQTAQAGVDYGAQSGALSFPANVTDEFITVPVYGTTAYSPDKTFLVNLSSPTGGVAIAKASGIGTIHNTNTVNNASISINNVTETDVAAGSTVNYTFAVSLGAPSGVQTTVVYSTAANTAVAGVNYTPTTGTLTFSPGTTSQNITVQVLGSNEDQPSNSFFVDLSSPTNGTIKSGVGVGTINYNNPPSSVSISSNNPSALEGQPVTFNVTLSQPSGYPITVHYSTVDGTALAGTNYVTTSGTLTFPANSSGAQLTQSVSVPTYASINQNGNLNFQLKLSNPSAHVTVNTATATGTIVQTAGPSLLINNVQNTITGSNGGTNFVFPVTLSGNVATPVTVAYTTEDETAFAGTDYHAESGTLTFAPGVTTQSISVPVFGSSLDQPAKTFDVVLSNPVGAAVTTAPPVGSPAVGTIVYSNPSPSAAITGASALEGQTENFNVTLSGPSGYEIDIPYATSDGTALAGTNYVAQTGTLVFAPGVTTATIAVPTLAVANQTANLQFSIALSSAPHVTVTTATAFGTVITTAVQSLSIVAPAPQTVGVAGTTNFVFTVNLSNAVTNTVTVSYATSNLTAVAGQDYSAQTGILTFAPGQTSQQITVPVFGSAAAGPNKQFLLNLSSATGGVQIANSTATATIVYPNVTGLTVGNVTVTQPPTGTTNAVFTVQLPAASANTVTVQYATANNTANAPTDYTATSGTLTFAPGTTSQQVTVVVNGNATSHADQTFYLNLSNAVNSSIATSQATGTIHSYLLPSPDLVGITLEVTDTSGNPITGSLSAGEDFDVEAFVQDLRTSPANIGVAAAYVNVSYPSNLATPLGTITYGPDFTNIESGDLSQAGLFNHIGGFESSFNNQPTGPNPLLLFSVPMVATAAAGQLQFTAAPAPPVAAYQVLLFGQNTPVSTSEVNYGASATYNVGSNSFLINSVSQTNVTSGDTNLVFTVTRFLPTNTTATVVFNTADGTAVAGQDYVATSGTLTFAPGATTETITVPVIGTTEAEPTKTFTVNLTNPVNAGIGMAQGTGTILNTNPSPSATVAGATAGEGQPVVFTVSLSAASGFPITIAYTTVNGTAIGGVNYTASSGTLTFAPGVTTQTISVPTLYTLAQKNSLNFSLSLSNPTNVTLTNSSATGTITYVTPTGVNGVVYVDTNDNGVQDPGEVGISNVAITISSTTSNFTESTLTAADGTYSFLGLTPGTYTVTETQPGFFVNGIPASHSYTVTLATSQDPTLNFSQLGLRAQFVSAFDNRRAYLASTEVTGTSGLPSGTQNIDLTQGDVWLSFDNGWQNERQFQALFNSSNGTATMTLYDNNFNVVATSTPSAGGATLLGTATPGTPYFLRISGTNTDVSLKITESVSLNNLTIVQNTTGATSAVFTATLSAPSTSTITAVYTTADGTAVAGRDYTATTGTVTFLPGVTSESITVPVLASTLYGATKSFSLNLSSPVNAIVDLQGTGTIVNETAPPNMTIGNAAVNDPASGISNAVFVVRLLTASSLPATVTYSTAQGTLPATDYVAESGTITFAPGATTQTISVPVRADATITSDETFLVNLSSPTGAFLVNNQAVGTVLPPSAASAAKASFAVVANNGSASISNALIATPAAVSSTSASSGGVTAGSTGSGTAAALSAVFGNSAAVTKTANTSSSSQSTDEALAANDFWVAGGLVL